MPRETIFELRGRPGGKFSLEQLSLKVHFDFSNRTPQNKRVLLEIWNSDMKPAEIRAVQERYTQLSNHKLVPREGTFSFGFHCVGTSSWRDSDSPIRWYSTQLCEVASPLVFEMRSVSYAGSGWREALQQQINFVMQSLWDVYSGAIYEPEEEKNINGNRIKRSEERLSGYGLGVEEENDTEERTEVEVEHWQLEAEQRRYS